MTAAGYRKRLSEMHGGRAPIAVLCLILLLAFGLRADFAKNHIDHPVPDAAGYARIAESLYTDGQFGRRGSFSAQEVQEPTNYSPGVALFAAGIYYATGGVKPLLVRMALAVLGTVAVFFTYLIARRLVGGDEVGRRTPRAAWAGVIAAFPVAIYPTLLEYNGMIMSEPLAVFLLAGAVLAFLWADERKSLWAWALPGVLFGLTALTRPDYLVFGGVFALLALLRVARHGQPWGPRLIGAGAFLAAFLVPIIPWTVHNYDALNRFVPVSTGGGKAFYIGTYLPGHGQNDQTKDVLLAENPDLRRAIFNENPVPRPSQPAPWLDFSLTSLPTDGVQPQRQFSQNFQSYNFVFLDQILDVLAARSHPGENIDAALTKDGWHNFRHYWKSDPLSYGWMYVGKVWHMWRDGPRATMRAVPWRVFHLLVIALGLIGLIVLAMRRRWEALLLGALTLGITAESVLLLAEQRRVLVLIPIVAALAGAGAVWVHDELTNREQTAP